MIRLDILSAIFLILVILLNAIFHHNWVFIGLNYNLLFLALFCCFEYLKKEKPNMSKGLEELKRIAYENACCRCQYYIDKKCTNEDECVWKIIEKELIDYKRLIEIISKYIEIDDNYDEINSGSTKAFKVCIPNCISIEEDDDYIDDCYPNSDYDFINNLLKEVML